MMMRHLHIRINELLNEKSISKNQTCKDLELSRGNFNRYCRDEIQRIDKNLILKLDASFTASLAFMAATMSACICFSNSIFNDIFQIQALRCWR